MMFTVVSLSDTGEIQKESNFLRLENDQKKFWKQLAYIQN